MAEKAAVRVSEGYSRLSTVIPVELHKAIKIAAITDGRPLQDVITEALDEWVRRR
jgi:hypothetical protein